MNFGDILNNVGKAIQGFLPKPQIISPIASTQGDFLNPALYQNAKIQAQNDAGAQAQLTASPPPPTPTATPTPTPTATPTPHTFQQVLGTQTAAISPTVAPTAAPDPANLTDAQVFEKYHISPQVGLGILGAEGGKIGANNPGNVNATDSNPQGATNYPTRQAGVEAAAQTMQALLKKAGYTGNDPIGQLRAISAHYAGDPATWRQRSIATGGAGKYYPTWADFVMNTPAWKNQASQ